MYTNPRGGTSCEGRIYYAGPRPRPGTLPRIKLDLTVDELVALPPVTRPVGHPYSDLPEEGITANCYAYEEVFGRKFGHSESADALAISMTWSTSFVTESSVRLPQL